MRHETRAYLEDVRSHLHLDLATEKRIVSELCSYFRDKVDELQEEGLSERDATREAIKSCGRARAVARLMYEAYSKGSWSEALVSSLPHLLIAGLFALHLWHDLVLGPAVFISIVCVTLFGWWRGKPNWLYSWIGYSFLPLLIAGFAYKGTLEQFLQFLQGKGAAPGIPVLLLTFALIVLSLWIIIRTAVRVIRRDWILASFMLVTLPIFSSWLLNVEQAGGLFRESSAVVYRWDAPMALALALLGITSAAFIRLRQRRLKVGALLSVGSLSLAMVGYNLWGGLGLLGFFSLSIFMLVFLLIPALVESKIGHGEQKGEAWWAGDWVQRPSITGQ